MPRTTEQLRGMIIWPSWAAMNSARLSGAQLSAFFLNLLSSSAVSSPLHADKLPFLVRSLLKDISRRAHRRNLPFPDEESPPISSLNVLGQRFACDHRRYDVCFIYGSSSSLQGGLSPGAAPVAERQQLLIFRPAEAPLHQSRERRLREEDWESRAEGRSFLGRPDEAIRDRDGVHRRLRSVGPGSSSR